MKIFAAFLSILLASAAPIEADQAAASASEVPASTVPAGEFAPLIITAPWLTQEQVKRLKQTRAAGGFAAVSGLGVILYSVAVAAAGPIAWASCLLFIGGLTAYLSHRKLHGHNDFGSGQTAQAPQASQNPPAASAQKTAAP